MTIAPERPRLRRRGRDGRRRPPARRTRRPGTRTADARGGLWRGIRRSPLTLVASWAVVAIVIAWALAPALFAPFDAYTSVVSGLQAPSATHPFGTDSVGRDQLSRVIYGSSESLLGALVAVTVGMVARHGARRRQRLVRRVRG